MGVDIQWGVQIPPRDGVRLNATLCLPRNHARPTPAIITLTPYIGQIYHDRGLYFASHGYPFLSVDADQNPTVVFALGRMQRERSARSEPASYTYDPQDISLASLERSIDPENRADQRMVLASSGKQLIYHSATFQRDTEISGFFRFSAWMAIDQPDTDFRVSIYEIAVDGTATLLSSDFMRARYRESLRVPKLIDTKAAIEYDFSRFNVVARLIRCGSRLRLVLGPINSIYSQKNCNSGGAVSEESMRDARAVLVTLFHGGSRAASLDVPLGQLEDLSLATFAP